MPAKLTDYCKLVLSLLHCLHVLVTTSFNLHTWCIIWLNV